MIQLRASTTRFYKVFLQQFPHQGVRERGSEGTRDGGRERERGSEGTTDRGRERGIEGAREEASEGVREMREIWKESIENIK